MCGVSSSISNRKPIPKRNPRAAGNTDHEPWAASISMAGIRSDQTDAATITPEAKPNKVFCSRIDISPRMKNTKAEPSIVPRNGMRRPANCIILSLVHSKI